MMATRGMFVCLEVILLKYFAALFILATLITGFCDPHNRASPNAAPVPASPPVDVPAERYAIYSYFLKQMFVDEPVKLMVIESQTHPDSYTEDEWARIKVEPEWQAAVDDYKAKRVRPVPIEDEFKVSTKVVLVSKEEVDHFFCEGCGWWEAFYRKYPKSTGLITFSNVGFNPEMNYALVDVGYSCGGLCGRGGLVLLVKKDGKWVQATELITWIS